MTMWFLPLIHLIWRIIVVDLYILNYPCIYGKNLSSSWWVLVLISFWVLFASISFRIFAVVFIVSIKLSYSLLQLPYLCVDFVWQYSLPTHFTEDTSTSGALPCWQSGRIQQWIYLGLDLLQLENFWCLNVQWPLKIWFKTILSANKY